MKKVTLFTIVLSLVAVIILLSQTAYSVTRTWDGGGATNNWSEAANWSGDVVPEINDSVVFNATSSKSCVIDVTFIAGVNSLSLTTLDNGYSGTVSFSNGLSTSFFGNLVINSGTLTLTDGNITHGVFSETFTLNGGVFNTGSGSADLRLLFQNGGTFNGSTGPIDLDGGIFINNGTFNASSGLNTFATNASQNFQQTGGIFNGNGTVDINGVFQLTGGTFNASPGITRFSAGFVHTTGGTFNHQNGTVIFDNPDDRVATVTTNGNREIFNNVAFLLGSNTTVFNFANPVTFQVNGQLEMINGVVNSSFPSSTTNGLELRGDVIIGAGADGGTTVMRFAGGGNQAISNLGGVIPSNAWTIDKPSGIVSLATDLTLGPSQALNIVSGEFSQGASFNLTTGVVDVGTNGIWRNNGLGDITLGGNVTNAGIVDIDGVTISCNESDLLLIRSTVNGVQRGWSGTGSFFVQDSDVQDQGGTASITSFAGTNTGNNGANWSFDSACSKFSWDGGGATNNWSEAANWQRNIVPISTLVVHFNATSSKNAVIDTSLQVNGMRIESGYGGTISHATPTTLLTVGSGTGTQNYIQTGGTYTAGLLDVIGETQILGGTFAGTNQQKRHFGNLLVSNATYSSSGITKVAGNLTVSTPVSFTGPARIEFDGGTNSIVSVPSGTQFSEFFINKTSEVEFVEVSSGSNIVVTGKLDLVNGQLNGETVTVLGIFDVETGFDGGLGGVSVQSPSTGGSLAGGLPQTFLVNSPSAYFVTPLLSSPSFQFVTLQSGTLDCSPAVGTFLGNYSQSGGTFLHGSPSLTFDGTFTMTGGDFQKSPIGGSTITLNGDVFLNGGTFGASSFRTFINNDFRINGASFVHNNGTVIFNAPAASLVQVGTDQLVFNNVRFDSSFITFLHTLDGTSWITANGSSQFRFGGFEKLPASPAIPSFRANGNVTMTNFNFNTLMSLRFEGTTDQTFTQTGGFNFNGWTINKSSGTLFIAQDTTVDTLFLQNGTITTNANTLTPSNISRTTGYVIGNLKYIFTAPTSQVFHVGTPTGYSPVTANVTAVNLVQGAEDSLKIQAIDGTAPSTPPLPNSTTLDRYWEISESGDVTADLTFTYLETDVDGGEAAYNLIRAWPGVGPLSFPNVGPCPGAGTPCVDTAANTIFMGGVVHFADFWTAGAPTAPTASTATISGRVLTSNGRGVPRAVITLTNSDGEIRTTISNPFGYYRFEGVPSGQTYIAGIRHKSFQFSEPSRVIFVGDDLSDLDFVAIVQTGTSGPALLSGYVTDKEGRPLVNVVVELVNMGWSKPRTIKTDLNGFYMFEELDIGDAYNITVRAKGFAFANAPRMITLINEENEELFKGAITQ